MKKPSKHRATWTRQFTLIILLTFPALSIAEPGSPDYEKIYSEIKKVIIDTKTHNRERLISEEIIVKTLYAPKKRPNHYFRRIDIKKAKCEVSKQVNCNIPFKGKNLYDVAYYFKKALRNSIEPSTAQIFCDINRRKGKIECRVKGEILAFSKEKFKATLSM
jgi:uncharacterized protein (DUF427 family)